MYFYRQATFCLGLCKIQPAAWEMLPGIFRKSCLEYLENAVHSLALTTAGEPPHCHGFYSQQCENNTELGLEGEARRGRENKDRLSNIPTRQRHWNVGTRLRNLLFCQRLHSSATRALGLEIRSVKSLCSSPSARKSRQL